MDPELRQMVTRVVGRVLAERGLESHPTRRPTTPRPGGIHVAGTDPASAPRPGPAPTRTADPGTGVVRPAIRSVAVGSDHGGFAMKQDVLGWVRELGYAVVDFGTRDENPVDYPDVARTVAEAVARGQCDVGILVDGAGIGSAMAANKVPGIRAAVCWDDASARNAREHNFANVLSLGGRMLGADLVCRIVRAFLATDTGAERHARRVAKIEAIERFYARIR